MNIKDIPIWQDFPWKDQIPKSLNIIPRKKENYMDGETLFVLEMPETGFHVAALADNNESENSGFYVRYIDPMLSNLKGRVFEMEHEVVENEIQDQI